MNLRISCFLAGLWATLALAQSAGAQQAPASIVYPEAAGGAVVDDFHGIKVADPYRWLEDLDSPATRDWVTKENALTESYIGKLPARDVLRSRLRKLHDFERFGVPFPAGPRLLYTHNTGLQNQSVLVQADGGDGKSAVVLDPNIHKGTKYPATLIITGDHDTRVMPAHSFKFAAALQAAQAGTAPTLLYIEKSSGHGGGPTVDQEIEQGADTYAFLIDRLGVTLGP